ncbi:MAG TPA: hypothetical protein ENI15_15220 [Spirochaetes bacterium]|nr:hypothetical protein [Spirochaetota bacterium]
MKDDKLFLEIKSALKNIEIFDTHEHLMYESERRTKKLDFFMAFYFYTSTSLVSSGMKLKEMEKLQDPCISLKNKWDIVSPYWDFLRSTMDFKVISIVANDIFGVEKINLESIVEITEKINETKRVEHYKNILKERSKISFVVNDIDNFGEFGVKKIVPDEDYFLPVIRLDRLMNANSAESIEKIEEENNININSLANLIELIDNIFEQRKGRIYALKTAIAYCRDLFFEDVSFSDAEKCFIKILKLNNYTNRRNDSISLDEIRPFQDFIYHYLIKKALDNDLPIQIHTGIIDGNANDIRNTNPAHLTNLLLKYKNAVFDIFHIGYPFTDELIAMVKMFPNCFVNMCWIPHFSKYLYKQSLNLFMDILPSNKIFGFGGDYLFVEGTYAAQKIAREAIAEVIYERVLNKDISIDDGINFTERILNKNAEHVYLKKESAESA